MLLLILLLAPPSPTLDWVRIEGGTFRPDLPSAARPSAKAKGLVTVETFEITRTEVTVAQYAACVAAKACPPVRSRDECQARDFACLRNCKAPQTRPNHPRDCVLRFEAEAYARWIGGALPTWTQWTFAGRNRGKPLRNRWGDTEPTCDEVVFDPSSGPGGWPDKFGCGRGGAWAVCSKPKGNTAQGLCDMRGNLEEMVRAPYTTVPGRWQITLGGSHAAQIGGLSLTMDGPGSTDDIARSDQVGFRVVRPVKAGK